MRRHRQSSILGEVLTLLFLPFVWAFRQRRATPEQIRQFYRSAEWKRMRYDVLARSPRCRHCGAAAADGAKMNVDHRKPLSKRWDLRLRRKNLQTLCASCNWGKGGR
jgi:5-methylcytosine-specific restriction endonuclease McrA